MREPTLEEIQVAETFTIGILLFDDAEELDWAGPYEVFGMATIVMEAIRLLPQPVIAEVGGLATAAGCQLVASCDMAVASDEATESSAPAVSDAAASREADASDGAAADEKEKS